MTDSLFLQTIQNLRKAEHITLFSNVLSTTAHEDELMKQFLQKEFRKESFDWPLTAPEYNADAALWAAKLIYFAAQLILYRGKTIEELQDVVPEEDFELNASTILSADLCLRFLPDLYYQLLVIDKEDELVEILNKAMHKWHYSAIKSRELRVDDLDFTSLKEEPILPLLYAERVVFYEQKQLAEVQPVNQWVKAALGIYADEFWKDYKFLVNDNT